MKQKIKRAAKSTLSIVLCLMMVFSTMLIGTVTAAAVTLNVTVYFVKPDGWTNAPKLAIGHNSWKCLYAADANIDNKVYIFSRFSSSQWENADGFYFTDTSSTDSGSDGDYYAYKYTNSTDKIQSSTSKIYKLDSGNSGTVTGYTDFNKSVSASVYVRNSDGTLTENNSIATANVTGKNISNSTSNSQVAKFTSAKFTTTSSNSSYRFVGWYKGTSAISGATSTTYTISSVEDDTTLRAVYELDKTTLATPTVSVTNSGKVTSDTAVTLTVTNASSHPSAANVTYGLYNSSNSQVATFSESTKSITFSDSNIPAGTYKVMAIAGNTDSYADSAYSTTFTITKTQLYSVTLQSCDTADVTATYTDAYGVSKSISEGSTAKVPSGNTVTVTATNFADKTAFENFTYGASKSTSNPATITVSGDMTIKTNTKEVVYKTVKIAVVKYADPSGTNTNKLSGTSFTYTYNGTQTGSMTKTDETAYFVTTDGWGTTIAVPFNIYTISVPEEVTSITLDSKVTFNLSTNKDYYAVYHHSSWKTDSYSESDKYFDVDLVADTSVDSGAKVTQPTSTVKDNDNSSNYLYKSGSTITLTATPSNSAAFALDHWSDDTSTTVTSPYTVTGNATLTAYFTATETYAINITSNDYASVTVDATGNKAYNTQKVTVTVTPDDTYKCTGLTVKGADGTTITVTKNSNGTYSFTMPAQAVTVTATVQPKTSYTVTAKSSDESMGTATASAQSVYEGDTVTLTATTSSYTFTGWTLTGTEGTDYSFTSGSASSTSITIKVNNNITATANFTDDTYYLATGDGPTKTLMTKNSKGYYVSSVTVANGSSNDDVSSNKFTIYNKSSSKYATSGSDGDTYWIKGSDWTNISSWSSNYTKQYFNNTGSAKYVLFDPDANDGTGAVKLVDDITGSSYVNVYAKDGTCLEADTKSGSGTSVYGETVITAGCVDGITPTDKDSYKIYSVSTEGSVITVQTTLNDEYKKAKYYVAAFVVNGKTYLADTKSEGVYYTTISIPADSEDIEITPVYFNQNIEDNGDYIKFYIDASELDDMWGNTLSCYTYYFDSDGNTYHGDGGYPGQPLLLDDNGKYYTYVSRYYYNMGVKTDIKISGLTIGNMSEKELVHGNFLTSSQAQNHQTYDYNDFVYLAETGKYDIIEFDIRYRDTKQNKDNVSASTTLDISAFKDTTTHNGFNTLTDYDGNAIDIIGNEVTDSTKSPIYIVSTGNNSTSIGNWSTIWYVYDEEGKIITSGAPSDFIARSDTDENTDAYNTMNSATYNERPTYICYESEMTDGGIRVDGHWKYANSSDYNATITMLVQYKDSDSDDWTYDTDGHTGSAAYVDGETEATFEGRTSKATINAVAGNGYLFIEWVEVDEDGNYKTLPTNAITTQITADTNYTIVARFEKVSTDTLIISHRKYTGDDAIGGLGYYYVTAVVNHNGTEGNGTTSTYTNKGTSSDNILVPVNINNDTTVTITLETTCSGYNTFIDWYELINNTYYQPIGDEDVDQYGKKGTVSYTFTLDVADLYDGATLLKSNLQYFSDINSVSGKAVLKYKYYNSFNEERTYVKNIVLSESYLEENGYTITSSLVYENAPAIDDLYKDCVWTITDSELTDAGTNVTIWASHPDKNYTVKIDFNEYGDGNKNNTTAISSVLLGSYLLDDDDNYYQAPENNNSNEKFSYWSVMDSNSGSEIMQCYSREFNLLIQGDYYIKAVYGVEVDHEVLTISDAFYSRETYTNSTGTTSYDYLYADFILAYRDAEKTLLSESSDYRTGLIVEFDNDAKVTVADAENGKLDDSDKVTFAATDTSVLEGIINNHTSSTVVDKHLAIYNFEIDNSQYNNKNRVDFYVKFQNTTRFRHYAMRAYYYVVKPDGTITITDPVYFYLYDIGNSVSNNNVSN
jgi:hypothetical protein